MWQFWKSVFNFQDFWTKIIHVCHFSSFIANTMAKISPLKGLGLSQYGYLYLFGRENNIQRQGRAKNVKDGSHK